MQLPTKKKRITVQSAKAKGRNLQKSVVQGLLDRFASLTLDDVRSCSMGSNGADVIMSTAAKQLIPYEIECKAKAAGFTALYDALEQAGGHGDLTPVAVVKQDRKQPLVVMTMEAWLDLISR